MKQNKSIMKYKGALSYHPKISSALAVLTTAQRTSQDELTLSVINCTFITKICSKWGGSLSYLVVVYTKIKVKIRNKE